MAGDVDGREGCPPGGDRLVHGRSLEQGLRESLAARYPTRDEVLGAVRERWAGLPEVSAEDIDSWVETGRDQTDWDRTGRDQTDED